MLRLDGQTIHNHPLKFTENCLLPSETLMSLLATDSPAAVSDAVNPPTSLLEQEARRVLLGNPHLPANYRLDVREAGGGLRLSGKVDSYFHKQMAQESLRDLPGVTQIENLLEVLS